LEIAFGNFEDAVDQALNATTALFNTLTIKAAFHSPVSDQKISGWLSHKRQEILAMRPSRCEFLELRNTSMGS
jgi:hypothetical protein